MRRFNAAIRKTYKRTPTQIRRLAHQKDDSAGERVSFPSPFPSAVSLEGACWRFSQRAPHPASKQVDRQRLSPFHFHERLPPGYFEVSPDEGCDALAVRVQIADPRSLYRIIERIRSMFDLNADWAAIAHGLGTDPELSARIAAQNRGCASPVAGMDSNSRCERFSASRSP